MSSRLLAVVVFAIVSTISTACGLLPAGKSVEPTVSAPPTTTPAPTTQPSPTALPPAPTPTGSSAAGFYLRAWYTQALPPQYTFSWLPPATISDGLYINGNVAVPAIYPGPLLIVPVSSTISDAGIAKIIDEATRLGLLSDETDFTGAPPMPGAKLGQLEMTVDGKTYELTGHPDIQIVCITAPCEGGPGSPEAFAAFWQNIITLDQWLPDELGPSEQYNPERVALLLSDVDAAPTSPSPTVAVPWPLETPLAEMGTPYPGAQGTSCLTLTGNDLATMLPVLQAANELTVFMDATGTTKQPMARVLVPGELSPCETG